MPLQTPKRTKNPKEHGSPYQYFHYSAFGESLIEKNANYGQFSSPYRFNGKELDAETGNYYYGMRYYNPEISIWLSVDKLAGKYPHVSPYNFSLNNPVNLIDPNGDSVNVAVFMLRHQDQWQATKSDLEKLGGVKIETSKSGNITYEIDEKAEGFSQAAREKMISAFGDKDKHVRVLSYNSLDGGSKGGGKLMRLDMSQIQGFIDNTSSDLNNKTLGFGMTFLHELGHTDLGGNLKDVTALGSNGANVDQMNTIRAQMGTSWGHRYYYSQPAVMDANTYIPFSKESLRALQYGFTPTRSFIKGTLR